MGISPTGAVSSSTVSCRASSSSSDDDSSSSDDSLSDLLYPGDAGYSSSEQEMDWEGNKHKLEDGDIDQLDSDQYKMSKITRTDVEAAHILIFLHQGLPANDSSLNLKESALSSPDN